MTDHKAQFTAFLKSTWPEKIFARETVTDFS